MADVTSDQETLVFNLIGGEVCVRELVGRSYDLTDLGPGLTVLCTLHLQNLDGSRGKLLWFLCGWLGGPNYFIERFDHPRLHARHVPSGIGMQERDQWMRCMALVVQDIGLDGTLQIRLIQAFWQTADWMRNVQR